MFEARKARKRSKRIYEDIVEFWGDVQTINNDFLSIDVETIDRGREIPLCEPDFQIDLNEADYIGTSKEDLKRKVVDQFIEEFAEKQIGKDFNRVGFKIFIRHNELTGATIYIKYPGNIINAKKWEVTLRGCLSSKNIVEVDADDPQLQRTKVYTITLPTGNLTWEKANAIAGDIAVDLRKARVALRATKPEICVGKDKTAVFITTMAVNKKGYTVEVESYI